MIQFQHPEHYQKCKLAQLIEYSTILISKQVPAVYFILDNCLLHHLKILDVTV